MLKIVALELKSRNYIILLISLFIFFFGLYVFLDFEGNTNYTVMKAEFSLFIVIVHIFINILINVIILSANLRNI